MTERSVVYRLSADIGQFRAQMAQASASVRKAAGDMTGATKDGAKFRAGLDQLGGTAGKVGLIAAAGLGAAVIKAANFDQAMSNVQAATMESASNMELLREAAIQAGADTAFSASEAAAGIENLAKAGVSTADILDGGLSGALDLAAAGGLGVAEAAEAAATAMTQFSLAGDDVPHIADLLAAAAGKAQGDVSDFAMALNQSGLVAAQMGVSIEETTGALAAFASAGLLGSDAGTSFKSMLLRLANPSKEASRAMDALGISAYDANGQMVTMSELAGQLEVAFQGKTQAERDAAMATIFGSDAIRAANVLYSQGADGIADWTNKVDDSGYAADVAATKLDNLKGDLEEFSGSLETALIGAGDGAQGPLRSLVQNATDAVNVFNKMPSSTQNAAAGLAGLTAIAGGGLWAFSKTVQGIANTREALTNLGDQSRKTRTALSVVGKGIAVYAAVESLGLIDSALDGLLNTEFEGSKLERSLAAMSRGAVDGTIAEVWGADLGGLNRDLDALDSTLAKVTDWPDKLIPGDWSETEQARTNFEMLDEALAGMVETGREAEAADIFASLAEKAAEGGNSVEQLTGMLEQYGIALDNAGSGGGYFADALSSSLGGLVPNLQATQTGLEAADAAAEGLKAAMQALSAELDGRANFRDYEASLDDFTKSIKENGKSFDITTAKGRANQAALDGIASSALSVADGLEGAARKKFLTGAIADIKAFAADMNLPKSETKALIALLREANKADVNPDIRANTGPANAALAELDRYLDRVARDRYVTVYTSHKGAGGRNDDNANFATGGHVSGPGTATSDSIPAYLSNGEYVIRAAAVEKYGRGMFDHLNAMRFASGGYASRTAAPVGAPVAAPSLAGLEIVGTLRTPFGPAEVRGVVRSELAERDRDGFANRRI